MARKSKAEAIGSDKIRKTRSTGRSTTVKAKKSSSQKKQALEKIGMEVSPVPARAFDPTDEQIQMRAYFISERRRRFDLPGDANSDWLEAKRQLLAETRH